MKLIDNNGIIVYETPDTFRKNVKPVPSKIINCMLIKYARDEKGNHIDYPKDVVDNALKEIDKYYEECRKAKERGEYI